MLLHVDMDAFYASIEVRDIPHLAGRSLIVGVAPNKFLAKFGNNLQKPDRSVVIDSAHTQPATSNSILGPE